MYGNLIQLSGDLTARTTWRRVPFASVGGEGAIDEARLQEVLFRHADLLPLGEIDPAYNDQVPVCMELGTRAGSADALYLTPTGRIILAEFKLWRNPGARREVIGQILDYPGVLASWSYDDLEREVRNRTKRSPFEIVSEAHGSVQEHIFVDRVARRLKRGEFLLLIIGDGIREGVEAIVDYVQDHSGLRFNLALVEAAIFHREDGGELIIPPRVLARTRLVPRTILVRRTILEETDDDPLEEHEPSPMEDANERFWTAVLHDFAFDDRELAVPAPAVTSAVYVGVKGSGWGNTGLWFDAYLNRGRGQICVDFRRRTGVPEAERVFDDILETLRRGRQLQGDGQGEIDLPGLEEWSVGGKPRVGFRRPAEFGDGTEIRDLDEAVEWMRERFNRLVSKLHQECRRRLSTKG